MICKNTFFEFFPHFLADNKRLIAFFLGNTLSKFCEKNDSTFVFFAVLFTKIVLQGVNISWGLSAFPSVFFYKCP